MSNVLIGTAGLCLDAIGVSLLGFDLIRLQRRLRREAGEREALLESMAEEYGGIAAWAEQIKRGAKWIPQSAYERHHAEDPVSYNVQNLTERAGELGECINGLGEHVAKLTTYLGDAARIDTVLAASSLRYSIAGVALLLAGFVFQVIGANL